MFYFVLAFMEYQKMLVLFSQGHPVIFAKRTFIFLPILANQTVALVYFIRNALKTP